MLMSLVAAVFFAVAASILLLLSRRGHATPDYVPVLLPMALLFLVASVPVAIYRMIVGFQAIAQAGVAGEIRAVEISAALTRALQAGAAGSITALAIVAALHAFGLRTMKSADVSTSSVPRSTWSGMWLIASCLVIVPVAATVFVAQQLPYLVAGRAIDLAHSGTAAAAQLSAMSQRISSQLVFGILAGLLMSAALFCLSAANLLVAAMKRPAGRRNTLSWAALVLAAAVVTWNLTVLSSDLRWLDVRAAEARAYDAQRR